jgi:flagellar basal-body rod modification protein FlgD
MITPSVTSPTASSPTAASSPASSASLGLGQGDFLKLLTTQLQYQNPLDPMSGSDFTAQLAQFSSLEGIQQLNTSFGNMMLLQSVTQGANLIGRQVTYGAGAASTQGKVDSVQVSGGQLVLMVAGNSVPLSQVQSVSP